MRARDTLEPDEARDDVDQQRPQEEHHHTQADRHDERVPGDAVALLEAPRTFVARDERQRAAGREVVEREAHDRDEHHRADRGLRFGPEPLDPELVVDPVGVVQQERERRGPSEPGERAEAAAPRLGAHGRWTRTMTST